jgi:myo-inositol-hexaphosphate 3-phosphohydrolase
VRVARSAVRTTAAAGLAATALPAQAAAPAAPAQAAVDFDVTAAVETPPVSHSGCAADDPAIRVDPTDPPSPPSSPPSPSSASSSAVMTMSPRRSTLLP